MLGDNIRKIRKSLGISINKLSNLSGLSLGYLSDLENNKSLNPTKETLDKIAKALNVPVEKFLDDDAYKEIDYMEQEFKKALPGFFKLSKEASEQGISPEDIKLALNFIKQARERDR